MATRKSLEKGEFALDQQQSSMETEVRSYTAEEEKRVVRKLDRVILPMMCCVFFLQYLDKQSLSYAAVAGLIPDLKLTASDYSWCTSIFYIGQLVSEYPFIYLMSRFKLTKLVGLTIIIWGGVCMCLAAPHNFTGFAAVRFLLGFSEGAVSPAFVSITSYWYKKEEHTIRTALWISMNAIAQVVGSFLMYGIAKNESLAIQPWRVMFIVCGALTVAAGATFFFFMPTGPKDSWFLNEREKEVLTARMAVAHEGGDRTNFSMAQLKEALLDYKVHLIFCFGLFVTMQSPVLIFASLIIKGLGYSGLTTLLYGAPSGAVQLTMIWIGVFICSRFPRNRCAIAIIMCIPPLIGCFLLLKLPQSAGWGVVVSSWLASCITAPWSILLSLSASNIKGNTKRSVANAIFFIGYCAGCIASPQLWTHKPRYFSGVITAILIWFLLIATTATWWILCRRENMKRDAKDAGHVDSMETVEPTEGLDLTDKTDKAFRYTW